MTDVSGGVHLEDADMPTGPEHPEIAIRITSQDPMEGEVTTEAGEPERFLGWLGLLKVLEQRLPAGGRGPSRPMTRGGEECAHY